MIEREGYRPITSKKLSRQEMAQEAARLGYEIITPTADNETKELYAKIESGAKTLLLFIRELDKTGIYINRIGLLKEKLLALTYVANENFEKNDQETTQAYTEAQRLMQEFADEHGQEIHYILGTNNKNMALWALTKAHEIFNWEKDNIEQLIEKTEQDSDEQVNITLTATIKPQHEK